MVSPAGSHRASNPSRGSQSARPWSARPWSAAASEGSKTGPPKRRGSLSARVASWRPSSYRLLINNSPYTQSPNHSGSDSDPDVCQADSKPYVKLGEEILEDFRFEVLMSMVILANAAVIGAETEMPGLPWWYYIEQCFLVIFGIELAFRASIYKKAFFRQGPDFFWNVFDVIIVGLGIVDLLSLFLRDQSSSAAVFRTIRIFRIVRVFRIIRFLRKLYLLAYGLVEAAQAVCWVTVLMFFVLYVCSILMVRFVGCPADDDPHREFLLERFGGIPRSMFSMFQLMASPELDSYVAQDGLLRSHPTLTAFLIAFTIFGSFGMIALLTGVISESMFEKNRLRWEEERSEKQEANRWLQGRCEDLFRSLTLNSNMEASMDDVRNLLPHIEKMFSEQQIDIITEDLERAIACMDIDHSAAISEKEFVSSVMSLASGERAAGVRLQELYYALCLVNIKVSKMEGNLKKDQAPVMQKLDQLLEAPVMQKLDQLLEARQDVQTLKSGLLEDFRGVAGQLSGQLSGRAQHDVQMLKSELIQHFRTEVGQLTGELSGRAQHDLHSLKSELMEDLRSVVGQLQGPAAGEPAWKDEVVQEAASAQPVAELPRAYASGSSAHCAFISGGGRPPNARSSARSREPSPTQEASSSHKLHSAGPAIAAEDHTASVEGARLATADVRAASAEERTAIILTASAEMRGIFSPSNGRGSLDRGCLQPRSGSPTQRFGSDPSPLAASRDEQSY